MDEGEREKKTLYLVFGPFHLGALMYVRKREGKNAPTMFRVFNIKAFSYDYVMG